ncbi:MAG: hypothetical protein ABSG53_12390 [Thermoguttaceae bacterium]|jgi:hypothetical protein
MNMLQSILLATTVAASCLGSVIGAAGGEVCNIKVTNGYIGPPSGGGSFWNCSAGWENKTPEFNIDLDLGQETPCAASL